MVVRNLGDGIRGITPQACQLFLEFVHLYHSMASRCYFGRDSYYISFFIFILVKIAYCRIATL